MRKTDSCFLIAALFLSACGIAAPAAAETPAATLAPATTDPLPIPTPSGAPLRLVLPTPGAEPVSGWRPPLYPIPWAVSSYDHFYFARPNPADQVNWPLADYRYGQMFFDNIVHTGVDIDAFEGSPVLAAGPGTVVWAGWGLFREAPNDKTDPYGMAVAIRHDFGYNGQQLFTIYAHMSRVDVTEGQYMETGEQIGLVGATGNTTGPHLHFEVRLGKNSFQNTYNPELWMAPPQGWGVLVGHLAGPKREPLQLFPVFVTSEETNKTREIRTYGGGAVNSDPYYRENLVLSDLPAGLYRVVLTYEKEPYQFWVEIFPGQVTYFTFDLKNGFTLVPPPTPALDFLPTP
ncbi:MAG: hypothetical protein HFACDABA_02660 [Anaerolineales bacterium]|nr:hypothetical protein [Anaerolineales bacterium]